MERIVNGISGMNWFEIAVLLIMVVWFVCLVICPFAKEKLVIVEQTLKNGKKRYTVKHNWFLGLPFLYRKQIEDYGLFECYVIRDSLEAAEKYVREWYEKYNEMQGKKVKKQKRIRIANPKTTYK